MMGRVARWVGWGVAGLIGLAIVAAIFVYLGSQRIVDRRYDAAVERVGAASPAQVADAPRQARLLGCVSCHGEGLKGRVMFDAPGVATVHATNLTQTAADYSDEDLARAIRQGIRPDGRALWIMPSPMYSRLGDSEVAALIAYIRSLPRSAAPSPGVRFGPLGRLGVVQGKLRPAPVKLDEFRMALPVDAGAEHAEGRRLAGAICSECHGANLSGTVMDNGTVTPDLTLAAAYDGAGFARLMRTGEAAGGRKLGLMAEVARDDFVHFTDGELGALHGYLRARAEAGAR